MKNKIESFQVLRGIAILIIFASHCNNLIVIGGQNRLMYLGGCGVSVFIALSGFLAAYKYSEASPTDGMSSIKAKLRKFGWLHLSTLIVATPLSISLLKKNVIQWVGTLLLNGTLLQAWIPTLSVYFSFNAVSWYLSLTIAFAALTPFAVHIWKAVSVQGTVVLSTILAGFELALCYFLQKRTYVHYAVYVFPITRFLDFIIGGGLQGCKIFTEKESKFQMAVVF